MRIYFCLILVVFLSGSCTTFKPAKPATATENLINAINNGDIPALTSRIMHPFLLDSEIISAEQDIINFWEQYIRQGFRLQDAIIIEESRKIQEQDFLYFGESRDIEIFFQKYLPQDANLVKLKSGNKVYYLLIKTASSGIPAFYGFKGAVL